MPEALAAADPLDRPVAVVHGTESSSIGRPATDRIQAMAADPQTTARDEPDELRQALHARLASLVVDPDRQGPIWLVATAALNQAEPAIDAVDEAVALATVLVDHADAVPLTAAIDRFLLAVTLCLRSRLDGDADADRVAGAESLLAAFRTVPPEHPAAIAMLLALGAFLDDEHPLTVC